MNKRWMVAAALMIAIAALAVWRMSTKPTGVTSEAGTPGVSDSPEPRGAPRSAPTHDREKPESAASETRPVLDCGAPTGDAATSTKGSVTAAAVCGEFQLLVGKKGKITTEVDRSLARHTLQRMVDDLLVAAALVDDDIVVTDAQIDAAIAALHIGDPGQPAAKADLKRHGVDMSVVRREVRRRLQLQALRAARAPSSVSDAAMRDEYQAHPERYLKGGMRTTVQAYLARVPPNAPAKVDNSAKERATAFAAAVRSQELDTLRPDQRQLTKLADFEIATDEQEPELTAALKPLNVGQWTGAVRTRAGWMVCKVLSRKAGVLRPLEEVKDRIRVRVAETERIIDERRLLQGLRAAADIRVLVAL